MLKKEKGAIKEDNACIEVEQLYFIFITHLLSEHNNEA